MGKKKHQHIAIVANNTITNKDEILVNYGNEYDLNEVGVSHRTYRRQYKNTLKK